MQYFCDAPKVDWFRIETEVRARRVAADEHNYEKYFCRERRRALSPGVRSAQRDRARHRPQAM